MKLDSRWFDRIRSRSRGRPSAAFAGEPVAPDCCHHPGCAEKATHKAPRGRGHEGQYLWFCLDHVREYNKSYNYFADMPLDAVAAWQKDSLTGHRPTWGMGVNASAPNAPNPRGPGNWNFTDPFSFFGEATAASRPKTAKPARVVRRLERKSLTTLNLDETATAEEIKARYKELVKRLHPDANGGDRGMEDTLREIIQAYNHLKEAGWC